VTEPSLPQKVVAVDEALKSARIPHAFGGAIALAYYAEPRVTIDMDVNVFLTPDRFVRVRDALAPLGVDTAVDLDALERDAQCRLRWDRTPVDLFFTDDPFHDAMKKAARLVPFGDVKIRVLSPEHLLVCKAAFDRAKDWIDIEQMLAAVDDLDLDEVRRWLNRFVGNGDAREKRFEELVERLRGE
jgi:hypothetical protein